MKPPLQSLRLVLAVFCVLLLGFASSSQAAVQGNSGTTSAGSIDLSLISLITVRISGLDDLSLGTWGGTGDATGSDNICIGTNGIRGGFPGGFGIYRILANGDGQLGNPAAFTLSNGARHLSYNAFFNDAVGIAGRQPLTPGVALTDQRGTAFSLVVNRFNGCIFNNANVSIVVPEAELLGAAGVYTGTLTLVLSPE